MSPHWYRTLDPYSRQAFWTSFSGFGVNALNVQLYAFALPTLLALWGLSHAQAGLLAAVALMSSAAGGWIGGLLADRLGRARLLPATIAWVAISTALCGVAQGFEQLLIARALQGLCFGADLAIGAVFIGEVAAPHVRGRMVGMAQSGWAVGWGLAAVIATASQTLLPTDVGWRIAFAIVLLPTLLVFTFRRSLRESDIFLKSTRASSWRAIFSARRLPSTIKGSLLATGMHSGYWAIATWWPAMLRSERGLSATDSAPYLAALVTGSFFGYVFGAWLSDTAGRKAAMTCFAVSGLFIALLYIEVPVSNITLLLFSVPLGFVATGAFGVIGPILAELYPTELRGSGLGFCYNIGRGMAGLAPALIGASAGHLGVGHAMGLYVACAYGLVLLATASLPETRGRKLASLSETM